MHANIHHRILGRPPPGALIQSGRDKLHNVAKKPTADQDCHCSIEELILFFFQTNMEAQQELCARQRTRMLAALSALQDSSASVVLHGG